MAEREDPWTFEEQASNLFAKLRHVTDSCSNFTSQMKEGHVEVQQSENIADGEKR